MKKESASHIAKEINKNNRRYLARAITLVESNLDEHRETIEELFPLLDHKKSDNSIRIGISGSPGVGKSSFIEVLGLELIKRGHKVAVLAVDPSSPKSGGSILGDKTRMEQLSQNEDAFIRPSPSKESIGGVAHTTRESIYLCEAAGFDIILIETVGVGQSEYDVAAMVDFFYLLMLPNAGDELQGIKKGIIELADSIIVHKADKKSIESASIAKTQYENALHIISKEHFWQPNVLTCSSLERSGFNDVIENVINYIKKSKDTGYFTQNRSNQRQVWFENLVKRQLVKTLFEDSEIAQQYDKLKKKNSSGNAAPLRASQELTEVLKRKLGKK